MLLEACDVPLVVAVAPAGYGKTTVLREWAARDRRPFGWVTADASAPIAIARALGDAGAIELGGLASLERVEPSRRLHGVRELLQACDRPFGLVMDDPSPALITAAEAILGDLPPGAQLALAVRREPALPLGRLRTQRRVFELRTRDLATTRFEAAALLDRAGTELAPDEVEALLERTEGWPAGLHLAAMSLADQPADAGGAEHFSGADYLVWDYVRDEILAELEPEEVAFLLRSSVLERLSGPLCDAALERNDSARMLGALTRGSVPLARLDREGRWYRYRRLFAESLRAELRRLEPGLERELHRRASVWHEAAGDVDGALHHAVAAGEAERSTRLLWAHLAGYLASGRSAVVLRRLESIDVHTASSPRLALVAAHAELARGRVDVARRWAMSAAALLERDGTHDADLDASVALVTAAACDAGPNRMREDAARAERLLPAQSPWRAMASLLTGVAAYLAGDRETARSQLEEGVRRGVVDAPDIQAACLAELAMLAIDEEDWERAAAHALRARAQVDRYGIAYSPASALVLAASALVKARRGDVDGANGDFRAAAAMLEQLTGLIPWYAAQTHLALARAALRLSNVVDSRAHAAQAAMICSQLHGTRVLRDTAADTFARIEAFSRSGELTPSALTKAELRILQFLPTHLSFREIADRLFVSANTVKTQAHAVYRKLDVSSRSDAVGRAQTLGLLDA